MSKIRLLPVKGTRALLAIDGPASATFNTIVEAADAYEGSAGNAITLALAASGTWVPNVGTLTLAGNASAEVKAELDLDTVTGDLDTIVEAAVAGVEGNDITITVVGDSALAEGVTIDEVGNAVTIHFEDGVSTVADVEAAITADATLIAVKTTGTGATVLDAATDECADESLASGATETVTIGSTVYSWRDAATTGAFDVTIGATASDSIDNLIAAINLAAGSGTLYGSATTVHPTVRAYVGAGDTMVVHTNSNTTLTAVGTLIATTETMASGSWGATTLADGTDGTNVVFSVAGTAISCTFAGGYSTVSDFEAALLADATASALIRTKTAGTTPLYRLVVTDDDFTATALAGGGATASAAPTATDGTAGVALPYLTDRGVLHIRSTNGSGTMTVVDGRLRGWNPELARWCYIKEVNGGTDIAEIGTDLIDYTEAFADLRAYSRLHFSVASLGGTATEIEVNFFPFPAAAQTA